VPPALPTAEELARSLEARLPSLKLPEIRRTAAAEPVVAERPMPAPLASKPEPPKDVPAAKPSPDPVPIPPPKPAPKPIPVSPPDPFASLEQEMATLLGRTPGAKEP
jgi:hypothetical protein